MIRIPKPRTRRLARLLRGAALAALLLAPCGASARETLVPAGPQGAAESTPIGANGTVYWLVGEQRLVFPVQGPGTLSGYARAALSGPDAEPQTGSLKIAGFLGGPAQLEFRFEPSASSEWSDGRPGVPSGGRKLELEIPAGEHDLALTSPDGVWVVLYWDGPAQPVAADAKPGKSPWDLRGAAGLGFIYNDNILTASVDDIEDFENGIHPERYAHETTDDLVVSTSIEGEARRDFFAWGQTRLRGKIKRWTYTHNSIKTNIDFDFYARQYFGRDRSLELYLHAAPEQYIRQLTDRTPLQSPSDPLEYREFRFQRNIWNLSWRQKLADGLDGQLTFERNYRYYNQPFMENDIEAWELRGSFAWDATDRISLGGDYSYEDGNGRGIDMEGETLETTDNSDPSYVRDLYRAEIDFTPPWLDRWVDRVDFIALYMDYYYTTDKLLVEDPYHVGRRDEYTKFTLETRRRISRPLTAVAGVRRTERVTTSPWEGDLTTDKAFVQWQYWIDLTYRF